MFGPACGPGELKFTGHPAMVLREAYVSRGKDIGVPADVSRWPIWRRRSFGSGRERLTWDPSDLPSLAPCVPSHFVAEHLPSPRPPPERRGSTSDGGQVIEVDASLHLGRDEGSAT